MGSGLSVNNRSSLPYLNQPKPTILYGPNKSYIGFHIRNLHKKWGLVGIGRATGRKKDLSCGL